MRRVVSLYLPTFPTDRVRRRTKLARERPLVTAAREGSRRVVMAADAAAGCLGLTAGMTVAQAQALVSGLTIAEHDGSDDAAALQNLAAWAVRRYSPIATPDPPDGLVIDSTGCDHLFGGEAAMLADIAARLDARGITVRIGLADTPGAAYAVARHATGPITIVGRGGAHEALRPLPVAALRLPAEIVSGLTDVGFTSIGQVIDAPRPALTIRFGPALGQRLDWVLGAAPELVPPYVPDDRPQRRLAFTEPIAGAENLEHVCRDLARAIAGDLQRLQVGARRLDFSFERVDRSLQTITIGLARPSRDPDHVMRMVRERLPAIDPGFGIEALAVIAAHVEPLPAQQLTSPMSGAEAAADVGELVDRVANLAGVRQVFRLAPVESDRPERSVRRLAAVAPRQKRTWCAWPRPTRLLHPAEPITVMPLDRPHEFIWRGQAHRIAKLDGPERLHGEWWRGPAEVFATRDYYRVEDESGAQFWLVHANGRWRLQGLFG